MGNIVEADYRVVQERSLPVIASEIREIEGNVCRVALDGAVRIGRKLKEAKDLAGHGEWEKWCSDNLGYNLRTAQRFMEISEEYGSENSPYAKATMLSDLSISKALALLQVPEEEIESFVQNHEIEEMTVKELQEEIKELKARLSVAAAEAEMLRTSGADPEKIADLTSRLEKQKEKNKKLQDDIKVEKERTAQAVEEAKKNEREAAKIEAEQQAADRIRGAEEKSIALTEEIHRLERRIENASDEAILYFKLKVDQLQENFAECRSMALSSGSPDKLISALRSITEAFLSELIITEEAHD